MPIELVGNTGITTPGMESTNMPTVGGDAVVESGSNSDGEWTRWADGTQIVRRLYEANATPDGGTDVTGTYRYRITEDSGYPVPFLAGQQVYVSLTSGKSNNGRTWACAGGAYGNEAGPSEINIYEMASGAASGLFYCHMTAVGRWK